jgi:hypothetical protein
MAKYFIDTSGNDDNAYGEAVRFACALAREDAEVKRIVILVHTKQNTGWFDRLLGPDIVKKMFQGVKLLGCETPFKIETMNTIKDHSPTSIVIACGLDDGDLFKIDDFYTVKSIIAIPWLQERVQQWIGTWGPLDIRNGGNAPTFPLPTCPVQKAMRALTDSINMSTGITHPADNNLAKTYVLSLHRYETRLRGNEVAAYLIRELGWETDAAKELGGLIDTLNNGKSFRGGERSGWQNHYKRWQQECEAE